MSRTNSASFFHGLGISQTSRCPPRDFYGPFTRSNFSGRRRRQLSPAIASDRGQSPAIASDRVFALVVVEVASVDTGNASVVAAMEVLLVAQVQIAAVVEGDLVLNAIAVVKWDIWRAYFLKN
ncbi:hypothetical protein FJT64_009075 [Amphibalanus amphitrite]|uniref:Uncharacterized protein n=1 Tax=Amphibalanus amphitrite TaxID=1232801 RepID=A0A6A4VNH5_AMPAM|nr:hypothetical protein FJT64_009075 [Amphibalanus amphitrite]